ncbi:MAG: type VI secretion system tip protein VgrG [Saprospiraceae bacterium]|nr:type VI secretion system tip protein VgrG [Saprospiraceae bacterium]
MFELNQSQMLPPIPSRSDLVTFTIKVNNQPIPDPVAVSFVKVYKQANKIPYALFHIIDGNVAERRFQVSDMDLFSPGNPVEIQAGYHGNNNIIFKGLIIRHKVFIHENGHTGLEIECKDDCVKLTVGRKNKYFFQQTDQEIIEEILRGRSLQHTVDSTTARHQEMVQFHATDWDFLVTRAEANGMLVLINNGNVNIKAPDFDQQAKFPVNWGTSLFEFEAEMDARDQYPDAKTNTWAPADQEILETQPGGVGTGVPSAAPPAAPFASVASDALGLETPGVPPNLDYTTVLGLDFFPLSHTGDLKQEEAQAWAGAQMAKSRLAKSRGRVKFEGVADIAPGDCITLQGVGLRHSGKVYITGIQHEISGGIWFTHAQFGLPGTWFTAEYPDVVQSPASGLLPALNGLQIGVTTALESDPDGAYRIQVRLPMVSARGEGVWMRLASQDAGNNRGAFWLPEIGDEVVVGFLNDDPREGIVLGMLYSAAKPAPLTASDDNHEKGWITRSGIKMIFNDDKISLTIETPAGKKMIIDEDAGEIQIADENNNKITMSSSGIVIESASDLTLKAAQNLTIEAPNTAIKAQTSFKAEAQGQAQLVASGDVVVKGAFVRIN